MGGRAVAARAAPPAWVARVAWKASVARAARVGRVARTAVSTALLALVALEAGCGGASGAARDGAEGRPARGLVRERAVPGPSLGYAVRLEDRRLVSVELGRAFVLVVRALDEVGAVRRQHALRLGPPEWDVGALAIADARAYAGSADGTVREIDLAGEAPREVRRFHLGAPVTAVALSAGGDRLLTGTATGVLCLRRLPDGALLQCAVAHRAPIADLAVGGELVASAGWDGGVTLWRLPTLAIVRRLAAPGSANAVAFAPDGRRLAIARSGRPPRRSPAIEATEAARGVAADPAARIDVVDLTTGAIVALPHRAAVLAVAWTPDGARLVGAGWDRAITLWDPDSGRALDRVPFCHLVRDAAIAPDGRRIAVAGWAPRAGCRATSLLSLVY